VCIAVGLSKEKERKNWKDIQVCYPLYSREVGDVAYRLGYKNTAPLYFLSVTTLPRVIPAS
jgi:hypothetical protein